MPKTATLDAVFAFPFTAKTRQDHRPVIFAFVPRPRDFAPRTISLAILRSCDSPTAPHLITGWIYCAVDHNPESWCRFPNSRFMTAQEPKMAPSSGSSTTVPQRRSVCLSHPLPLLVVYIWSSAPRCISHFRVTRSPHHA
jgi:hypothetical protein